MSFATFDSQRVRRPVAHLFMVAHFYKTDNRQANPAFTLVEVVLSVAILALAMAGMIYGYIQTNYRAEWSAMSLAAQSFAAQAVEQTRAAQWDVYVASTDQMGPTNYPVTNTMLIPSSGESTDVITTVQVTTVTVNPPLRQIRADCGWCFPRTGEWFTNTVITQRAPDE